MWYLQITLRAGGKPYQNRIALTSFTKIEQCEEARVYALNVVYPSAVGATNPELLWSEPLELA